MPIIRITMPEGALDPVQRQAIGASLTDLIMEAEVGEATDAGRAITVVQYIPVSSDLWIQGGKSGHRDKPIFIVELIVAAAFLDAVRKELLHRQTLGAFVGVLPDGEESLRSRVWSLIVEIPHRSWGAAGQSITATDIAAYIGLADNSARMAEIKAMVAAAERQA